LRAALDAFGAVFSSGSLVRLANVRSLELAARDAWDAGNLALAQLGAHSAEDLKALAAKLDMIAAALADYSAFLHSLENEHEKPC
jgi:hypothetical protein